MQQKGEQLNDANDVGLWRKSFSDCILQARFTSQFWVIDTDGCVNFAPFLESMFPKVHVDANVPLKIVAASRKSSKLSKSLLRLDEHDLVIERTSSTDTLRDINSLVKEMSKCCNVDSDDHKKFISQKVIAKAQGSFL